MEEIKKLSQNERIEFIKSLSTQNLIDYNIVMAFAQVESGCNGFRNDERVKMRFEPYSMIKRCLQFGIDPKIVPWYAETSSKVHEKFKSLGYKYNAYSTLEVAKKIDKELAFNSISLGLFQTMGFHHFTLHYKTATEMFEGFRMEKLQIIGFFDFIKANNKLMTAIKNLDFRLIAGYYNGFSSQQSLYASHLQTAYNRSKFKQQA